LEKILGKLGAKADAKKHSCFGMVMADFRKVAPFADQKLAAQLCNIVLVKKYGEKKKLDKKAKKAAKKAAAKKAAAESKPAAGKVDVEEEVEEAGPQKWEMGRSLDGREVNDEEAMAARMAAIGDTFVSRFPPEPNGYLHIGHAKAMYFDFGLAEKNNGYCILRFDDTNPEKEEVEYIESIKNDVKWLGHTPGKITYSSDYFEEMYQLTIQLIRRGLAYVSHEVKNDERDDIKDQRDAIRAGKPGGESPWRNRSVEENLDLFKKMRAGCFEENEAILRVKGDLTSSNPNMWDFVAYRIRYTPHPHAGEGWCIYPTYDYTHCIIDSLEWITASCCTLEFENRRESYFWLLDVLDLYKPKVWEFSRLNITNNVLSKRKIIKLAQDGFLRGWSDPRLLTLKGLRRRGLTAEIINKFVEETGVTRADNKHHPDKLFGWARHILDGQVPRGMCVLRPLKITLVNLPDGKTIDVTCPVMPTDPSKGTYTVPLTNTVYIDQTDFRIQANKKFYGFAPGRTMRLKYAYNITYVDHIMEGDNVKEIKATIDLDAHGNPGKVKTMTWISEGVECEFRLYDLLFTVENPGGDDWLSTLNPNSEEVHIGYTTKAVLESSEPRFQFERVGYFVKDSNDEGEVQTRPVFNRITTLRETKKR